MTDGPAAGSLRPTVVVLTTAVLTAAALPTSALGAPAAGGGPLDLRAESSAVILGAAAEDDNGRSVAPAGDVNDDGFPDLIVGSRQSSPGDPVRFVAGTAYVIYGRASGIPSTVDLANLGSQGFRVIGAQNNEQVGFDVAGAGDVNADGVDDVIIGAQGAASFAGAAYVVYGQAVPDPADVDVATLGGRGFAITGTASPGSLGRAVDAAGDVNADGIDDVIVGEFASSPGAPSRNLAGAAYVVYGRGQADPADVAVAALGSRGFQIAGAAAGDHAGDAVAGVGDVNGDGIGDLAVGAPDADPGGPPVTGAGAAYLVYGRAGADPSDVDLSTLGPLGLRVAGTTVNEGVGAAAAAAGDVNADGRPDVVVGASSATVGNPARAVAGAALVVYGTATPDASDLVSTGLGSRGLRIEGAVAADEAGTSVDGAGDLNADGVSDLVIGAPQADPGSPARTDAGASFVVFGQPGADPGDVDLLAPGGRGFRIDGAEAGDRAGTGVALVSDQTGDGLDDVLVGANRASPGDPVRTNAGTSSLVAGFGPPTPPRDPVAVAETGSATVVWSAPAFERGSPVTQYTATADGPPGDAGTGATCRTESAPPTIPATTCQLTGLTPGATYRVTVTAANATGRSAPSSASAPFTPLAPPSGSGTSAPTRPSKVSGVSARGARRSILVRWQPASGSVTGYVVQQRRASATRWRGAGRTGATTTRLVVRKVRPDTRYVLRVSATSAVGRGPWSAPVRVRTR